MRLPIGGIVILLVFACVDAPAPDVAPDSTAGPPPPPAAPPADADEGWTRGPVNGGGNAAGAAVLVAVRTAAHEGFDRIVFEFEGGVPGYRIAWLDEPPIQCGSGNTIEHAGASALEIHFEPAHAHTDEGRPTVQERARRPGLDTVLSLDLVCDFEGQVDWIAGGPTRRPLRASTLTDPARVVLDLQH